MNTKNSPTSGPWTAEPSDSRRRGFNIESEVSSRKVLRWREENPDKSQDSFSGVTVATIGTHWNGSGEFFGPTDGLIGQDELEANVRLIEAAPKLLGACEAVVAAAKLSPWFTNTAAVRQCREALAAVYGEQQI